MSKDLKEEIVKEKSSDKPAEETGGGNSSIKAGNLFFNKKALERLQSPEDLDKYLCTTSPGVWTMIIACILLLSGFLVWCFFGSVAERVELKGVWLNGEVLQEEQCGILLFANSEEANSIEVGDPVYVDGENYTVTEIFVEPIKEEQITTAWYITTLTASILMKNDRQYLIWVQTGHTDHSQGKIGKATIVIDQESPFHRLFK